jgi:hypothetical protein
MKKLCQYCNRDARGENCKTCGTSATKADVSRILEGQKALMQEIQCLRALAMMPKTFMSCSEDVLKDHPDIVTGTGCPPPKTGTFTDATTGEEIKFDK